MALVDGKDNVEDIRNEAYRICQEYLSCAWKDITISEFRFSVVSGGLSNSLYYCALPEGAVVKNVKTPKEVLLRIYGPLQEDAEIIAAEAATFMLLAERKLGPKLYGVFPRGRLEEFIPSRIVKSKDYRRVYPALARELGKIHALDVPIRKVPDFWIEYTKKWLKEIESEPTLESTEVFEYVNIYRKEFDWLAVEMKKTNSKVVYCHNDLQGGNILLRDDSPSEDDPRIILIDFEFGTYNYRGFDLANQFNEWCFDYNPAGEYPYYTFDFEKYPSKQEQMTYIEAYLDQLVIEGVLERSAVEDEIQIILSEINLFSMAAHLLWSLWSAKMSFSSAQFAHREHRTTRFQAFRIFKELYLEQHSLCNGDTS